jgi:hypothetical protein
MALINVLHVLLIAPALIYIGYIRDVPDVVFHGLLGLGVVLVLYQGYRAYEKYAAGANPWVNLIHVLLVAPLLVVVGYWGAETPRRYFEMMMLLGFAALGYHGLYMIRE